MENKLNKIFNLELVLRILSLIVFIPMMIIPIFYSDFLLVTVYLLFNSIILQELHSMRIKGRNKNLNKLYVAITTFIFFIFILLNITNLILSIRILEIIIVIWLFDTFSFLGGKLYGGRKLMPSISSGKTVSGLVSGTIFTLLISQIYLFINYEFSIYYIFLVLFIILFAFLGDLTASIIKRDSSIKDSGSIMPGHGGLFDRLDSFLGVFLLIGLVSIFR